MMKGACFRADTSKLAKPVEHKEMDILLDSWPSRRPSLPQRLLGIIYDTHQPRPNRYLRHNVNEKGMANPQSPRAAELHLSSQMPDGEAIENTTWRQQDLAVRRLRPHPRRSWRQNPQHRVLPAVAPHVHQYLSRGAPQRLQLRGGHALLGLGHRLSQLDQFAHLGYNFGFWRQRRVGRGTRTAMRPRWPVCRYYAHLDGKQCHRED